MYSSSVFFLIAKRPLFFSVTKRFFIMDVAISGLFVLFNHLFLGLIVFFIIYFFVSKYTKDNPDFFDIFIETLNFYSKHPLYTIKKGIRTWEP